MSFADMKKRSKTDLSSLIKETEKISSPNTFGDTDIIQGVNRKRVTSVADLRAAIEDKQGVIALNVKRGDSSLFIVLRNTN